jgi:hypothetical protein
MNKSRKLLILNMVYHRQNLKKNRLFIRLVVPRLERGTTDGTVHNDPLNIYDNASVIILLRDRM